MSPSGSPCLHNRGSITEGPQRAGLSDPDDCGAPGHHHGSGLHWGIADQREHRRDGPGLEEQGVTRDRALPLVRAACESPPSLLLPRLPSEMPGERLQATVLNTGLWLRALRHVPSPFVGGAGLLLVGGDKSAAFVLQANTVPIHGTLQASQGLRCLPHDVSPASQHVHPPRTTLQTIKPVQRASALSIAGGLPTWITQEYTERAVCDISFLPHRNVVVISYFDNTCRIFDYNEGRVLHTIENEADCPYVSLLADEMKGQARRLDLPLSSALQCTRLVHPALSLSGLQLLLLDKDGFLSIFDLNVSRIVATKDLCDGAEPVTARRSTRQPLPVLLASPSYSPAAPRAWRRCSGKQYPRKWTV